MIKSKIEGIILGILFLSSMPAFAEPWVHLDGENCFLTVNSKYYKIVGLKSGAGSSCNSLTTSSIKEYKANEFPKPEVKKDAKSGDYVNYKLQAPLNVNHLLCIKLSSSPEKFTVKAGCKAFGGWDKEPTKNGSKTLNFSTRYIHENIEN